MSDSTRLFNPLEWADPAGGWLFYSIVGVILLATIVKLVSGSWDDWLDERMGRGSVRDNWLLRRIERDAGVDEHD